VQNYCSYLVLYNMLQYSSAPNPRNTKVHIACCYDNIFHSTQGREIKHIRTNLCIIKTH